MVVTLHILGRGGILNAAEPFSANYNIGWFLEIASFCTVDCYAIISGYVGYNRKTKYSNLVYIVLCAVFYLLVLTVIGYFTVGGGIESVKNSLMHIRFVDGWWYLKAYFAAFFIFPFVNLIVEKYDKKKLCMIIMGMFVLFSVIPTVVCSDVFLVRGGYSPWWLLIMYFVGAVIKKYDIGANTSKIKCFSLYALAVLLVFLAKKGVDYVSYNHFHIMVVNEYLVTYVSPLIALSAVFLVVLFAKIKTNKCITKIIAFMSPLTFGVYLIHTQYYVWEYLDNRFTDYTSMHPVRFLISVIFTALIIYLVCSIIECVIEFIFKMLKIRKISEYADKFSH